MVCKDSLFFANMQIVLYDYLCKKTTFASPVFKI